jgi:hypothetical protein
MSSKAPHNDDNDVVDVWNKRAISICKHGCEKMLH